MIDCVVTQVKKYPGRAPAPWHCSLNWLWLAGLLFISLYMAWDNGIIGRMLATDPTYITALILLLFVCTSLYCGYRALWLDRQWQRADHWRTVLAQDPNQQLQAELLMEHLRGAHQLGWFITGALIKLGLLGTVIGFVIMLGSIGSLESLELSQVQNLMQAMTTGMKVALNTTIVGLTGSLLLGLQYLLLDRQAEQLVASILQQPEPADGKPAHGTV